MNLVISFVLFILSAFDAHASSPCSTHNSLKKQAQDISDHVHHIGLGENRKTYEQLAKKAGTDPAELYKANIATGRFHCGGFFMTANIVKHNDELVLNSHAFTNQNKGGMTCTPLTKEQRAECYFAPVTGYNSEGEKYFIDPASIHVGLECPTKFDVEGDWAVVRLKNPFMKVKIGNETVDVTPWPIFNPKAKTGYAGDYKGPVEQIATGGLDPRKNESFPTICISDKWKVADSPAFGMTGCSVSSGNSGGGDFGIDDKGNKAFMGIVKGDSPLNESHQDHDDFSSDNYSSHVILQDDFYNYVDSFQSNF